MHAVPQEPLGLMKMGLTIARTTRQCTKDTVLAHHVIETPEKARGYPSK